MTSLDMIFFKDVQSDNPALLAKRHGFLYSLDITRGIYTQNNGSKKWGAFDTKDCAFLDIKVLDEK